MRDARCVRQPVMQSIWPATLKTGSPSGYSSPPSPEPFAAAAYKAKKTGKPTNAPRKPAATLPNFKPAFKLVDEIEKLAAADKNPRLLAKVAALRKWLQGCGGK